MKTNTLLILGSFVCACGDVSGKSGNPRVDNDGDGFSEVEGDCNDADAAINPAATELCDPADVDEDCDGLADDLDLEGAAGLLDWHEDADGDGYGSLSITEQSCDGGSGLVEDDTDCDDTRTDVSPDGTEICDDAQVDEDCDGSADNDDPEGAVGMILSYTDADMDGFGDVNDAGGLGCGQGTGRSLYAVDCDDSEATIHPMADEVCGDDVDQDCDGLPDDCSWSGDYEVGAAETVISSVIGNKALQWFRLRGIGDINQDGRDEFVVGVPTTGPEDYQGAVYLFTNPTTGAANDTHTAILRGEDGRSRDFGEDVVRVGGLTSAATDVLVVGADGHYADKPGELFLFNGPFIGTLLAEEADVRLYGASDAQVGLMLASGGDVDGDGVAEVVALARENGGGGDLLWFSGDVATSGNLSDIANRIHREMEYAPLLGLGPPMDLDGDGLAELVFSSVGKRDGAGHTQVLIIRGPATGITTMADADTILWSDENAGVDLDCAGDINGDGLPDLVFGYSVYSDSGAGVIYNVPDGDADLEDHLSARLVGPVVETLSIGGDADGDGFADVLIGDGNDRTNGDDSGAARLYLGPLYGTVDTPHARFLGPPGGGEAWFTEWAGDVDGDGQSELLLGAPENANDGDRFDLGTIWLFGGSGS